MHAWAQGAVTACDLFKVLIKGFLFFPATLRSPAPSLCLPFEFEQGRYCPDFARGIRFLGPEYCLEGGGFFASPEEDTGHWEAWVG